MLPFCYAQHLNYLLCTIFLFPNILQHYVRFDLCTIVTLEKLLGIGSFDNIVGNLACHQITLPVSSRGFGLSLMVQLVTLTFLGF
jgi:hypothetical protein